GAGGEAAADRRDEHRPLAGGARGVRRPRARHQGDARRDAGCEEMIFGVGTDLCQIERIEKVYAKYGDRFVDRLLMPEERAQFEKTHRKVRFLAMHFAAKE